MALEPQFIRVTSGDGETAAVLEEDPVLGLQGEAREHREAEADDVGLHRLVVEVAVAEVGEDRAAAAGEPRDREVGVGVVEAVLEDEAREAGLLPPPERLGDLGVAAEHPPVAEHRHRRVGDRGRAIDPIDDLGPDMRQREAALDRLVEVEVEVGAGPPGRRLNRSDPMKASELRAKDIPALEKEITDLLKAHFGLRMQKATQQLGNTTQLGNVKRDIARAKTILAQKKKEAAQ